jgi:hypothetical protein
MRTVGENVFDGRHSGAKEKYDYEAMSDYKPHILVRGEDFAMETVAENVVTAIRKGFSNRGLRIRGAVLDEDQVAIQVTGEL